MHLVHEGELADCEGVGEDDVGDCDEGVCEGDVFFGPGGPVYSFETAAGLACYDGGCNDGDTDGGHDGDEIDVA